MNTVVTILVTILIFGLLIFIHELGHYIAARIFHVGIKEFAIGMGPKLFSRRGKHNVFSVRALPIGGFVSMVGEYADDREEDLDEADRGKTPLNTIPVWRRIVICLAGPLMNVLLGMLVMSLVVVSTPVLGSTTVAQFVEGSTSDASGLRPGDTILEVAGQKIHVIIELNYVIAVDGIEPVDVLVERDGEEVLLRNVSFPVTDEDGVALANRDFAVYRAEKTAGEVVYQAFWQSVATIELTVDSLVDTFRGRYGISALSRPHRHRRAGRRGDPEHRGRRRHAAESGEHDGADLDESGRVQPAAHPRARRRPHPVLYHRGHPPQADGPEV